MRDIWQGKNINLEELAEILKQFFEKRNFKVMLEKSSDYRIIAVPKQGSDLCDNIEVSIRGKPSDFEIIFGAATNFAKNLIRLGGLTMFLGGGIFLRKGLASQEELNKLENDFWNFVDTTIASLEQDMAKNTKNKL
ncbi:MAG: hypothetical protein NZ932_06555 [Candidatus Bathyarchaeota archaeon]|nr:hypothetical protein [Candidatus Bathyarchaeota archaeon]MDW8040333.1 hypothetical protein [Nitrososphaerota archaeon]